MSGMPAAPLDAAWLTGALVEPGRLWTEVRVVEQTDSTNSDVLRAALAGAPQGLVIVAEAQLSGRGRQGRHWVSLPGAALTFSLLVRPVSVPAAVRGWLPLLTGVAVATAVRSATVADAGLKWPNDVLVAGRKLAGILAEQADDAIVVGVGLNITGAPVATATSLESLCAPELGAPELDRNKLLAGILHEFDHWYRRWTEAADAQECGLRAEYLRLCQTVGREVKVSLPGGKTLTGRAADVDDTGQLVVADAAGLVPVSAGDVIHVR